MRISRPRPHAVSAKGNRDASSQAAGVLDCKRNLVVVPLSLKEGLVSAVLIGLVFCHFGTHSRLFARRNRSQEKITMVYATIERPLRIRS